MPNTLLNTNSLALTLWALERARLIGETHEKKEIDAAINWIIKRQKEPGRYGLGFAAPTELDFIGAKLPTGERLTSRAGTSHILGEEAFWALAKWRGPDSPGIKEGLSGIIGRAKMNISSADKGRYCCATCSLAFWRSLSALKIKEGATFLERGLSTLSLAHDGKLGWTGFQFAYTVYSLASIEHPSAKKELKYAAGRIEHSLKLMRPALDPYGLRKLSFELALSKV